MASLSGLTEGAFDQINLDGVDLQTALNSKQDTIGDNDLQVTHIQYLQTLLATYAAMFELKQGKLAEGFL